MAQFFIGVDGGATKCIVRIEDETGQLIGHATSGPANIRLSVDQSWQSIYSAISQILAPLGIQLDDINHQFHVGMGLAGFEVEEAYHAFLAKQPKLTTLVVSSDSHTACLGAHQGQDGAIIIAGTGVVGFQLEKKHIAKVGGWGFPHDDEGGGAWLGLEAMKKTLQWIDGRDHESGLAKRVYEHFNDKLSALVTWANQANSTAFAELAPIVIAQAKAQDEAAIQLLKQAAYQIERVGDALLQKQQAERPLPCALIGSIMPFLQPYFSARLQSRLRPCMMSPDAGAILLVREHLKQG